MVELLEPHVLDYPGGYTRSVGPVIGRFLTGLRDGRIEAVKLADGRVLVPPTEYDPTTSAEVAAEGSHWIEVGPRGTVQTFTWVAEPRAGKHTLTKPFAFALIRPDGADTALLHMVDVSSADAMRVGLRVAPRWRAERTGHITDIEAWVPLGDGEEPEPPTVHVPAEDEQPVTGIIVADPARVHAHRGAVDRARISPVSAKARSSAPARRRAKTSTPRHAGPIRSPATRRRSRSRSKTAV